MNNSNPDQANQHMLEEMEVLEGHGISFERMTDHQIKIGGINYYPKKGTIYLDGVKKAQPHKGVDALLSTIREFEPTFI